MTELVKQIKVIAGYLQPVKDEATLLKAADKIERLENQLTAIEEAIRDARDSFAPDHPPYELERLVACIEFIRIIEEAME